MLYMSSSSPQQQKQNTIERVEKTNEEWKQELSPQAYYVLREEGTERPNSSELNNVKEDGTFVCAGCGNPLFTTSTKFDSGTGWPSFYAPVDRTAVQLKLDFKLGLPRTEVLCGGCDGHLGHVFEDGPEPTGQRFCMNGVSMSFQSDVDSPELAQDVLERQTTSPFKPSASSQIPNVVFNGGMGTLFFASFISRISELEVIGQSPSVSDFFPVLPAVYFGVMAVRGIQRIL